METLAIDDVPAFIGDLRENLWTMEASIAEHLKTEPRWAVFLMERRDNHLSFAEGLRQLRPAAAAITAPTSEWTAPLLTVVSFIQLERVFESNAGAVADECMDARGTATGMWAIENVRNRFSRATHEQLPTSAWMREVEQRRSSCRRVHGCAR